MERRLPGQGAAEIGLKGVPPVAARHLPTLSREYVKRTDPDASRWLAGEAGEKVVARAVTRSVIRQLGGELVCDVMIGRGNLDLVAVLPTGLFVIEVKHWSGRAHFKGDVVFHGRRQPQRLHAAVVGQRKRLADLLQVDVDVEGVIVLVPNGELRVVGQPVPGTTPVVMVSGLAEHLTAGRVHVLSSREIAGIATYIRFGGPVPIKVLPHPDDGPAMREQPSCPRCQSEMVERRGRYGPFLGCSQFPACKGARDIALP